MELLNRAAEAWFGWMWPMFWQVNLLIVVVWLVDTSLQRWVWPQVRYALWLLVLLKLVIPPMWSLPVSVTEPLVRPVVARFEIGAEFLSTNANPTGADRSPGQEAQGYSRGGGPAEDAARSSVVARAGGPVWQVWPFSIWILGVVAFCLVLGQRLRSLRRWHDAQRPRRTIPEWYHELLVEITRDWQLGKLPAIVFSVEVVTPAVCGIWRPVLFLPRHYLDSLSREEARHVLLHELAHLKRGDLWLHAVAMTLQIVYWFNPLLALARHRIQHVREICCDLTVAGTLREQTDGYRKTLLGTARELLSQNVAPGLGLLGVFEEPFRLVARLRWLERPSWLWQRQAVVSAAVVTALAIPLLLPMGSRGAPTTYYDDQSFPNGLPDPSVTAVMHDRGAPERSGTVALYQKNVTRRDRFVLGFRVDSQRIAMSECWIGSNWVVEKAGGRTLTVDFAESTLTFVDHSNELWAKTSLPLDPDEFLADDHRRRARHQRTYGEVIVTGHTREIDGIECKKYRIEQWRERDGRFQDQITLTVYASEEPTYDHSAFDGFLDVLRRLHDRDPDYRRELQKIRGLQLRLELRQGNLLRQARLVDLLESIEVVPVPQDLFAIPEHYERVDRLADVR